MIVLGGVFKIVVPDNLSPVVSAADPLNPTFTVGWLEYAQVRGFFTDPARVRSPKDKPQVERTVQYVRGSFFAGEDFADLAHAQARAVLWCSGTAGLRVHGTTQQRPAEVFAAAEAPLPTQREELEKHRKRTRPTGPGRRLGVAEDLAEVGVSVGVLHLPQRPVEPVPDQLQVVGVVADDAVGQSSRGSCQHEPGQQVRLEVRELRPSSTPAARADHAPPPAQPAPPDFTQNEPAEAGPGAVSPAGSS